MYRQKDDADSISEKWADYSSGTISKLFEQGRKDAMAKLYDYNKFVQSSSSINEVSAQQQYGGIPGQSGTLQPGLYASGTVASLQNDKDGKLHFSSLFYASYSKL